jgi:hypothetical protein
VPSVRRPWIPAFAGMTEPGIQLPQSLFVKEGLREFGWDQRGLKAGPWPAYQM